MTNNTISILDNCGILSQFDHQNIVAAAQHAPFQIVVWTTHAYDTQEAFIQAVQGMVHQQGSAVIALNPLLAYFYIDATPVLERVSGTVAQAVEVATAPFSTGLWGRSIVNAITSLAPGGTWMPGFAPSNPWPAQANPHTAPAPAQLPQAPYAERRNLGVATHIPPPLIRWCLDHEWPVDIVVSLTLWFCLAIFLFAKLATAPIGIAAILGFSALAGIVGTIYYLIILIGMYLLGQSGCIVGCATRFAIVIGLLYFPIHFTSRLIVLPMLRRWWDY